MCDNTTKMVKFAQNFTLHFLRFKLVKFKICFSKIAINIFDSVGPKEVMRISDKNIC